MPSPSGVRVHLALEALVSVLKDLAVLDVLRGHHRLRVGRRGSVSDGQRKYTSGK